MRNLSIVCISFSLLFLYFSMTMVNDKSYDLLKIVIQWQPGLCSVPNKTCVEPKENFTMHDVWPAKASGKSVIDCNGSCLIPEQQLIEAVPNLTTYWPDVESGNHYNFWKREWKKHGKCSEEQLKQVNYFELACKTLQKHDILGILKGNNISPNNQLEVDRDEVMQAIKNKTKNAPMLICKKKAVVTESNQLVEVITESKQLVEVILCNDKTGESFVNCPETSVLSCPNKLLFS